jgi:hypothetical protein
MPSVTIDQNGVLHIDGDAIFPIGVSEPPPIGAKASNGRPAAEELAKNGVTFVRTGPREFGDLSAEHWGPPEWSQADLTNQVAKVTQRFDEADANGLYCWLYLGSAPFVTGPPGSPSEKLLQAIVDAFKDNPRLLAYKGWDEPNNQQKPHDGLDRAYTTIKERDADHPVVIIQAPVGDLNGVLPYGKAFDVTGVDIFPISYPRPGEAAHPQPLTVVGDLTARMVQAARQSQARKPAVWTTLQISSSGAAPSRSKPNVIPIFPSLHDERFMAYYAIVRGARGLTFFGGHMTQVCTPDDAKLGWNWSFWRQVVRPIVHQLASADLQPALTAPDAADVIHARVPPANTAADVALVARRAGSFLYVIAVKTGTSGMGWVQFTGLPQGIASGEVLFEYVRQVPAPPWNPPAQVPRAVTVQNGSFQDVFRPHDVHVYRFPTS